MSSRRFFLIASSAFAAYPVLSKFIPRVYAEDIPATMANTRAQFYNFLRDTVQAEGGLAPNQNIVLNSTIVPFDIAEDTPFYNDELFRAYADRSFSGGVEDIHADREGILSERFSSQYRTLMNIVTAEIDQNHPEINNSLADLEAQQDKATDALTQKISKLDDIWAGIATNRHLTQGTPDYNLEFAKWAVDVRYSDQLQSYTDKIDMIDARIDATRRKVYSASEIAALDNYGYLSRAYNVGRPWTANIERSFAANHTPLDEFILADPRKLAPAMFDSSPLVLPIGDLRAFLTKKGERGFDTIHQSSQLNSSSSSWNASGSGHYLFWSAGAGGSGSSSMSSSVSKLNSLSISFENIAEYIAERSAWLNPGVLQDPEIFKSIKKRPELNKLQYIGVSLIIARGTTLVLRFSQAVNGSDWSQQSFSASGGVSFLGFGFGASGGSSSSHYSVHASSDATTVTIQDEPTVARVLGVRVEPFMHVNVVPHGFALLTHPSPQVKNDVDDVKSGKISYLEFQKRRIAQQQ
jgi:hypothetical protein